MNPEKFVIELCKAFGISEKVRKFELIAEARQPIIIRCEIYPDPHIFDKSTRPNELLTEAKEFTLVEKQS